MICHTTESGSYNRTKNFIAYDTLVECLNADGRLPKGMNASDSSSKQPTAYARERFGHGWADSDRDCQNSRMETLISQSLSPVKFKTTKQCHVVSGRWISPFSGETIYSASKIDIDHVVPLKWAWERGANHWSSEKRKQFANDPANLISVEASLNRQKGAKGLDAWLPPKNQCQYIVRFLRVKKTYGLSPSSVEAASHAKVKAKYCS